MRFKSFPTVAGFALLLVLANTPVANASSVSTNLPAVNQDSKKQLAECISLNHELSVLFLVDESMSLRNTTKGMGTDPDNRRVDGMKAVLSGLNAGASIDEKTKINVLFVGFGTESHVRESEWIAISDLKKLDSVASMFEKFNNDEDTNYIKGLDTSLSEFISRSEKLGRPNCKLLVWLTDGVYDTDGSTKLSSSETGALNSKLCNDGGIADDLREIGVTVVAVGLSNTMKSTPPDFSWLQKVTGDVPGCGNLVSNGWFIQVADANALVDELFEGVVNPPPGPLGTPAPCPDKPIDCTEIKFDVSEFVTTFMILVQPPIIESSSSTGSIAVSMIAPNNKLSVEVLPGGSSVSAVKVQKLNASRALIRVDFTNEFSEYWVGIWSIRFEGPGSEKARALAVFLSDYKVALADEQEPVIDRVKEKTQPIRLVLTSTVVPSTISTVGVVPELKAVVKLSKSLPLRVKSTGKQNYEVAKEDLIALFADPGSESSQASDITIEFTPEVRINDLLIVFSPQRINFALRNGEKYPSVKVAGVAKIDKKESAIVNLLLEGPQQGDGVVIVKPEIFSVSGAPEGKTKEDFSISGANQKCIVLEDAKSEDCQFQISANFESNSEFTIQVQAEISSRQDTEAGAKSVTLNVRVAMTKPVNKATTFWAAFLLFLLFVVVQLLLRLGFAFAMSRFEPLPQGSRRVLKQIMLSDGGQLRNADGGSFAIRNEDTEIVFDMDKPFKNLVIDGFEFSVSLMQTFITQKPKGMISSNDGRVFGSLGVGSGKSAGVGAIALAPRRQWAISVTQGDLLLLANGESAVNARMIVFFDEILYRSLDQQVGELVDRINTSSFASDLADMLNELRTTSAAQVVNPGEDESKLTQVSETVVTPEKRIETYLDPNDPLN